MRKLFDTQSLTALALTLWVALVPPLSVRTQRAQGSVVLLVEMTCDAKMASCSAASSACAASSSGEDAVPRASHRPVPRCCICISTIDLTMDVAPVGSLVTIQPLVRAGGAPQASANSRTIRPPVPPPKLG